MKRRSILTSLLFSLCLVLALPTQTSAKTYDLTDGSIIITAPEGEQQTVTQNGVTEADAAPVITGTSASTLTVQGGGEASVTLDNACLVTGGCAVSVVEDTQLVLTVKGENRIVSGLLFAGIQVEDGNRLTLTGDGSLDVTGGKGGAGIGGSGGGDCGCITIQSGQITAKSSGQGAGIGGGRNGSGGNITITGGTVLAASGKDCPDICGNITVTDGSVTASGGMDGNITLLDGTVTGPLTGNVNDLRTTAPAPAEEEPVTEPEPVLEPVQEDVTVPETEPIEETAENDPPKPVSLTEIFRELNYTGDGEEYIVYVGALDRLPASFFQSAKERSITLVIQWDGGDDLRVEPDDVVTVIDSQVFLEDLIS